MLGEAIVTGVVSSASAGLAGRIYGYLTENIRRDFRIRNAITRHRSEKKSLDTVIGNAITAGFEKSGLLDQSADAALKTILASSITISHCIDALRIKYDEAKIWTVIGEIFEATGGRPEERERFVGRFKGALSAVIEHLSVAGLIPSDEGFFYLKMREDRFRRVDSALSSVSIIGDLTEGVESGALRRIAACQDTESYLFREVAANVGRSVEEIDVHGAFGDIHRVPIDDVFVDLNMHRISSTDRNHIGLSQDEFDFSPPGINDREIVGWKGLGEVASRRVLLGNPGGGKSTHSKKLCLEVARSAQNGGQVLPIFLQLRSYAAMQEKDKKITIMSYIVIVIREYIPDVDEEQARKIVHYLMSSGRCFVVFDGLDEVLSVASRLEIAKSVNQFCDRYPLSSFLVTSRVIGYETAPMRGFEHFVIDKLNDDQIRNIFLKVTVTVLQRTNVQAEHGLETFMRDATKKADELITNPLLLTLITIVHARRKEIPDNRADLYSTCAELLFERWDSYRDIMPDLPERYRLYELLMSIARILYEDASYGGTINRTDLYDVSRKFFKSDYIDNAEGRAAEAARKLVDHLTGRAWILHEVGDQVFEFTHRTFLEFFYAKSLEARFETTDELLKNLIPFIDDGQRTLPLHLALQMRSRDKRMVADRIANYLTLELDHGHNQNFRRFCSGSIEYLTPSGDVLQSFISAIVRRAMASGDQVTINMIVRTENPLRPLVWSAIANELASIGSVERVARLGQVIDAIASVTKFSTIAIPKELRSAIEKIGDVIRPMAFRSPFAAKCVFDLGIEFSEEELSHHGPQLWTNRWHTSRSDSLFFDAGQMISQCASAMEGVPIATLRHARLARIVAPAIFGGQKIPSLRRNCRGIRLARNLEAVDIDVERAEIAGLTGLTVGLMMLVEAQEQYGYLSPGKNVIVSDYFDRVVARGEFPYTATLKSWITGQSSMFGIGTTKESRFNAIKIVQRANS